MLHINLLYCHDENFILKSCNLYFLSIFLQKIDAMTKPNVDPKELYTPTQASQHLGICRRTLDRYAAHGLIRYDVRAAGRRRVYKGQAILDCYFTML